MSTTEHGAAGSAGTPDRGSDSEADLQRELKREEREGSGTIGDMRDNRNLSGSSSWTTLPVGGESGELADAPVDSSERSRRAVHDEVADRLTRRGVNLSGDETDEDMVGLLEAVERFEAAVEARGGDLMVDEPVGNAQPTQPDNRAFVLPRRRADESTARFIERIAEARDRIVQAAG